MRPDRGLRALRVAAASSGSAPNTSILSGPGLPGPEGIPVSSQTTATFEFWADQPDALMQCSINGEPFQFCESPKTYTHLEPGDNEFMVQAINALGFPDLTPALYEWEIVAGPDTTPPDTVITAGPANGSFSANYITIFEFTGEDDQTPPLELDFECFLDGENLGGCDTMEEIEVETAGEHTFGVAAVDDAGNIDPTPAERTWTIVDMSPPDTEILSGPDSEITDTSATFEFAGFEELTDLPVNAFECALDNQDFVPCTAPYTVTTSPSGRT